MRVNYAFLFLNEYVESMCLEKSVAKDRNAVLGGNLRDAKKRHWWRKPQINVRKRKWRNEPQGTGRRGAAGRGNRLKKSVQLFYTVYLVSPSRLSLNDSTLLTVVAANSPTYLGNIWHKMADYRGFFVITTRHVGCKCMRQPPCVFNTQENCII